MTIVDSSSWIETLRVRGNPAVRSRVASLLDGGNAAWCSMIRLELWRGVRGPEERHVLELLESRVELFEINNSVWDTAISLMAKARSSGLTAPAADVLIVATAQYHKTPLEHCDQHMDHLLNLL
jgi:predicted nucleic acid-binding protein